MASKAYWRDDVFIDPNIFFGTAAVQNAFTNWAVSPTHDVTRIRKQGAKTKWNTGVNRLGTVKQFGFQTSPPPASTTLTTTSRRGAKLLQQFAQRTRTQRQQSQDSLSSTGRRSSTPASSEADTGKPRGARRFSSLARAGKTLKLLAAKQQEEDLSAIDKFKVFVRRIQSDNMMLNEVQGQIVTDLGRMRRTVSFGDVTINAIHKQVDKRKIARMHKTGQEMNRKKTLLNKFRRAVRLTVFCRRQAKGHLGLLQQDEYSPFISVQLEEYEPENLLFDPSKFKASKESRITDEFIRIMTKQAVHRTQQEIYYAQIALRNIQCLQDFPARMQRKIAEAALYENYDARRLIVRQGHPATSYYFILSGKVAVMVHEEGATYSEPKAELCKGQTFGELAIINRGVRQSTIIAKEPCEFLTISVEDYHNIFMAGGKKCMNDPDHDKFLQSLPFLKGWPLHLLSEKTQKCLFLYFKRGDVLVKDSQYSDWIIIVKSGSVAVLKKLRKVEAYEWKNNKEVKFVSEKQKREVRTGRELWKKLVLPELQVPLKQAENEEQEFDDYDTFFDEVGQPIPFVHPGDSNPDHSEQSTHDATSTTKVWNFGSQNGSKKVSHVQVPSVVVSSTSRLDPKQQQKMSRNTTIGKVCRLPPILDVQPEAPLQTDIKTINSELNSAIKLKDPDDITAADLNPEFVMIQTLTKGRVFGLSDLVLGQQTSFCVVSNGADCMLISKQLFMDNLPESLHRQLRMDLCPYPTEKELQASLQTSVDWEAFKEQTLSSTLKRMQRMRLHREKT